MLCGTCLQFEYVSFPVGKDTSVQGICAWCYMGMGLGVTSDLGICELCYISN